MVSRKTNDGPHRRRINFVRYRLRTLIAAVTVVAIVLVAADPIYDWFTSIPLSQAVDRFNAQAESTTPGYGAPLTEDEIVEAIENQLPTLNASTPVRSALSRIARTRRFPNNAALDDFPIAVPSGTGTASIQRWAINLDVMTGPKSGFALRIRETSSSND